jgi:pyruvate dehydrogenase E1 component
MHDGLRRMYVDCESVYYYLTLMNENYAQPAMPVGAERGIVRGGYQVRSGTKGSVRVTLLGSGTILREALAAAEILEEKYDVAADVLSITSFSELRRDALECERWNLLHPDGPPREPYVSELFEDRPAPVVAATDYMRTVPDQIRKWVASPYVTLGTDGFGRSDARAELRRHFEVDRGFIVLATLRELAESGKIDPSVAAGAVAALGIDPEKRDPLCD